MNAENNTLVTDHLATLRMQLENMAYSPVMRAESSPDGGPAALLSLFNTESVRWILGELERVRGERDGAVTELAMTAIEETSSNDYEAIEWALSTFQDDTPRLPLAAEAVAAALAEHDRQFRRGTDG
jgi:hypothetical protein